MQTDLITKVYFNEHLTHSCVGMPQGLQALLSSFFYIDGMLFEFLMNFLLNKYSFFSSNFMFSSRFMLFRAFLENKMGGGGV